MTVNTRKIKDRRAPRFQTFAEAIHDAEALADAEQRGTLRVTGNWTLGQAVGHVATWARFALDGYPEMPRPPWYIRVFAPILKSPFLNRGLPAGANLGNLPGGTFGTDMIATDQALRELREALSRLEKETPTVRNPFLGEMSHEEWIKLNLRHAELHFSFFHPS